MLVILMRPVLLLQEGDCEHAARVRGRAARLGPGLELLASHSLSLGVTQPVKAVPLSMVMHFQGLV